MDKRDLLLEEVLNLINKYSITAYDISQGTGISAVGIQKIINGESKRPLERTLLSITSYINNKYKISSVDLKSASSDLDIRNLPHAEQMELINKKLDYLMKSEELNRVYLKTLLAFHDIKIDMFESKENELDQIKKTVN